MPTIHLSLPTKLVMDACLDRPLAALRVAVLWAIPMMIAHGAFGPATAAADPLFAAPFLSYDAGDNSSSTDKTRGPSRKARGPSPDAP